nr:hypothetical protein [Tanacetum cinerariifolium]
FPAQSIRSSNAIALDSPYLLVLITGMSQNRQHVDISLIHLESRKSPTVELFDVDSARISIHHFFTTSQTNCCFSRSYMAVKVRYSHSMIQPELMGYTQEHSIRQSRSPSWDCPMRMEDCASWDLTTKAHGRSGEGKEWIWYGAGVRDSLGKEGE